MRLHEKLAGRFLVFDGPDGCGKSTQIGLLAERLGGGPLEVVHTVDPGGTAIGDRIRQLLLGEHLATMDVRCETLLFMASRAQLAAEVVRPALARGAVVLCDRFVSATCAYQGAAGQDVRTILELGRLAVGDTWPDLTVILDVPVELGRRRRSHRPADAMESRPEDFHRRVREGFLSLPRDYPGRVEVLDGTPAPGQVHEAIMEVLERVAF